MKEASTKKLSKDDQVETIEYILALADRLQKEVEKYQHESDFLKALSIDIGEFWHLCQAESTQLEYAAWQNLWHRYRQLVHRKASALNELSEVARTYSSMDEFWADTNAQTKGISHYTFWDTYEHGRRRQLESILARTYGAESSLLLNSGMSAIAVVIGMLKLRAGDKILTGKQCYFETSEYLTSFVAPSGIEVVRVPVDEPGMLITALRQVRPALTLVETVTNVPSVPVVRGFDDWLSASSETFFLIDNSVQSHLTRWFDIMKKVSERVLVVESATKYLTQECAAGVLYGCSETVEKARCFARATGQQLQEKAFNYLCEAELELTVQKLAQHSRNVFAFREELNAFSSKFKYIRTLNAKADNLEGSQLFRNGVGALIFLALSPPSSGDSELTLEQMHRNLLEQWHQRTKLLGLNLPVRAGFGWNETSARVYESERLNQADAPSYLRVSIGIEPTWIVRSLAQTLGESVCNIIR